MTFSKNPPATSHMGRVWEQQIQSCQNMLSSILKNHETSLNNESLQTLVTEVETIMNHRNTQWSNQLYASISSKPSDFENESNHATTWLTSISQISTVDVDGEGFKIMETNFGRDGRTNS